MEWRSTDIADDLAGIRVLDVAGGQIVRLNRGSPFYYGAPRALAGARLVSEIAADTKGVYGGPDFAAALRAAWDRARTLTLQQALHLDYHEAEAAFHAGLLTRRAWRIYRLLWLWSGEHSSGPEGARHMHVWVRLGPVAYRQRLQRFAACTWRLKAGPAHGQRAPRVLFDVRLPSPDGSTGEKADVRLLAGGDGVHYVLMIHYAQSTATRHELLAIGSDGALKWHQPLPLDKVGHPDRMIELLGGAASSSGDAVVSVSVRGDGQPPYADSLLHIAADGSLKAAVPVHPLPGTGVGYLSLDVRCLPTPDNAIILSGVVFGGEEWGDKEDGDGRRHRRWLGKVGVDGATRWAAQYTPPGQGEVDPSRVVCFGLRPDGSLVSIVDSTIEGSGRFIIQRHASDGRLMSSQRLTQRPIRAAVLDRCSVLLEAADKTEETFELVFVDDDGQARHRVPWPFEQWPGQMIAVGDGFAAVAAAPTFTDQGIVVRFDARGAILWCSGAARWVSDITATRNGSIAALVPSDDANDETWRLVCYADPDPDE